MVKLSEIKTEVRRGDAKLIHEMTSIPIDTIKAVLCGRRNSETDHGQEIVKAAQRIIANRKQLLTKSPDVVESKTAAKNTRKSSNQINIFNDEN